MPHARMPSSGASIAGSWSERPGEGKVATARKVGVRLYIMLRDQINYTEFCRRGSLRQKHRGAQVGMPEREHGPAFEQ
jgi:hypothetical protein